MSRRFSDEPVKLIHRIPTPEQLSAARPAKRSWMEAVMDAVAACLRPVSGVIGWRTLGGQPSRPSPDDRPVPPAESTRTVVPEPSALTGRSEGIVAGTTRDGEPSAPSAPSVQPEEVAELRAYLLSQQQDLARLAAQLQELKSLVVSQQQVLIHLGKELEAGSVRITGVASAPAKRNRAGRDKSPTKDKAGPRQDPPSPSLSV